MTRRSGQARGARPAAGGLRWLLLALPILALLAACGPRGGYQQSSLPYGGFGENPSVAPLHYYPPPGPPGDPWGPYIRQAAARYGVPEQWIRAVMQQESGGQEQAVSPVGAMGLMQIMPGTYATLQQRYGLGDDPYEPRDNIFAGAAYIREMYDEFGSPGFLAAYNAGPDRVESYLAGTADLPDETVHYLAAVAPNLGDSLPLSGPLATYAAARSSGAGRYRASVASFAAGCNLNLAYDPNHPCTTLEAAAVAPAGVEIAAARQFGAGGCDLDIAYDPNHPCSSIAGTGTTVAQNTAPQATVAQNTASQATVAEAMVAQSAQAAPPAAPVVAPVVVATASPPPPAVQAIAPPTSSPPPPAASPVAAAVAPPPALAQDLPVPAPAQPSAGPIVLASAAPVLGEGTAAGGCDPDLAYDPDRPCQTIPGQPMPMPMAPAPLRSPPPDAQLATAPAPGAHVLAIPMHDWAIQVGAFTNPRLARAVAENARAQAPGQLGSAALSLPPTPNGASILYRARLVNLSASAASDACWQLTQHQLPCVVVQPSRS
ncbi:MAG: lytic transglycosylase domain-containing protein [Stellaceae bacterium]